jgi:hypothetical protein
MTPFLRVMVVVPCIVAPVVQRSEIVGAGPLAMSPCGRFIILSAAMGAGTHLLLDENSNTKAVLPYATEIHVLDSKAGGPSDPDGRLSRPCHRWRPVGLKLPD